MSQSALELIDTHCHLNTEPLQENVRAVLHRAQAAGVVHCVCVGTSLATSQAAIGLARQWSMVRATVGVHPNDSETVTDELVRHLDTLAADPSVVAIGEVGLDFYREHASPARQMEALRGFIAIARRRQLPLSLHCREAYDALVPILQQAGPGLRGVIHCASGPPAFIQAALELGLYVSFAGNVTFPNAPALRQLVSLVPDDRLLIETDSPYLAPQPVRGQPNEPAYVAHTANCLATLRGIPVEKLGRLTSDNARRLFRLV